MAKVVTLTEKDGTIIYPLTHISAVFDIDGKDLLEKSNEIKELIDRLAYYRTRFNNIETRILEIQESIDSIQSRINNTPSLETPLELELTYRIRVVPTPNAGVSIGPGMDENYKVHLEGGWYKDTEEATIELWNTLKLVFEVKYGNSLVFSDPTEDNIFLIYINTDFCTNPISYTAWSTQDSKNILEFGSGSSQTAPDWSSDYASLFEVTI